VTALRTTVLRAAVLVTAAAAVASIDLPGRPTTLCLLRAATGVPCPLCGGTTAAVAVGEGRLTDAVAASPLVTLGAAALVLLPLLPASVRALLARARTGLVLSALAAGQTWQLLRLA
jgi:hypothetical protein